MENLIQALNSAEENARLYAVQDLLECGDAVAIPLVERLTIETSQVVRDSIVFSLKKIRSVEAFPRLFNLFFSSDAFLRNAAVDVFGSWKGEAVAYLTAHLDHSDREVRKLILDALYIVGTSEAVMAIRACLNDPAVNVRITAVDYLGQLADKESVSEMVCLLEREKEPMLRTVILESLSMAADKEAIQKALAIIMPGGNILRLEPIFLPEVIRMTGGTGDPEALGLVLDAVDDIGTYADDILQAIGRIKIQVPEIFHNRRILEKIYQIIAEPQVVEHVRYSAIELLLSNGMREPERLDALGGMLIKDPKMTQGGVRILHASGLEAGRNTIVCLMGETDDKQLRNFCEELLESATTNSV